MCGGPQAKVLSGAGSGQRLPDIRGDESSGEEEEEQEEEEDEEDEGLVSVEHHHPWMTLPGRHGTPSPVSNSSAELRWVTVPPFPHAADVCVSVSRFLPLPLQNLFSGSC